MFQKNLYSTFIKSGYGIIQNLLKLKTNLRKKSKRLFSIVTNSIKQTISQFISLILSVLIIHQYSKELWGDFSIYFLYTSVSLLIISWGNKEFLLREFSKIPSKITYNFYLFFNTRLVFILLSVILTLILFPFYISKFLVLWIISGYISQSLEVFWLYKREYLKSITIEILAFLFLVGLLYYDQNLNVILLIQLYSYYQIVRTVCYLFLNFKDLKNIHFQTDKALIYMAFSFFILSFVGFIQSRIDFLMIVFFEKNQNVAIYQVLNTYFILIHSLATFIFFPFIKNLYRINENSMKKIQNQIIYVAPLVVSLCIFMLHLITTYLYNFSLDIYYYILGFLITFPPYLYAVRIIKLFKENRQKVVLQIGLKAILINTVISFILLYFGYSLKGALIAAAIAQIYTSYNYLKIVIFEK